MFNVQDANFIKTKALPAAGASAATDPLDLGAMTAKGSRTEKVEFELSLPATPDLVDDKTVIIDIEMDTASGFGSETSLIDNLITVTGAGGTGAAAVTKRFRVPTDCEQFIRANATVLASGGDNTGVSITIKALF